MVQQNLVAEFLRTGAESSPPHARERITIDLATQCIRASTSPGYEEAGLLALFIGVANWGVRAAEAGPAEKILGADPAGRGWAGTSAGHGKHLTDCALGGLSIAHLDSSALQKVYDVWGRPALSKDVLDMTYDRIRNLGGATWSIWLRWAQKLVVRTDFQSWVVEYWLKKYWARSIEQCGPGADLLTVCINARIRNSVSGVARRVAGLPAAEQIKAYYNYKLEERGPSAADRAMRQVHEMERVGVLLALYKAPMPLEPKRKSGKTSL